MSPDGYYKLLLEDEMRIYATAEYLQEFARTQREFFPTVRDLFIFACRHLIGQCRIAWRDVINMYEESLGNFDIRKLRDLNIQRVIWESIICNVSNRLLNILEDVLTPNAQTNEDIFHYRHLSVDIQCYLTATLEPGDLRHSCMEEIFLSFAHCFDLAYKCSKRGNLFRVQVSISLARFYGEIMNAYGEVHELFEAQYGQALESLENETDHDNYIAILEYLEIFLQYLANSRTHHLTNHMGL